MWRSTRKFIWRFMVIFSFIVNLVLVVVLLVLALLLFDIKNNVAEPLLTGLHSSFVGLSDATIDWTIPVHARVPVNLDVPLNTTTVVILTENVPLNGIQARIDLPGLNAYNVPTVVNLTLPAGTELPVSLSLVVPVRDSIAVDLQVRAVIPLNQTQLRDPIENLRLTLEPIVRVLYNLPENYGEVPGFIGQVFSDNPPDLLSDEPEYVRNPWPGYSITAGLNYPYLFEPVPPENLPLPTGIIPLGGIPALDEGLRPEYYAGDSDPAAVNAQAEQNLSAQGVPEQAYDGSMGNVVQASRAQAAGVPPAQGAPATGGPQTGESGTNPPTGDTGGQPAAAPTPQEGDLGIISPGG